MEGNKRAFQVALVGNPNSGKTSLFNQLTGLQQKVGNFPGVTVEKKVGKIKLTNEINIDLVDFPGTYSFYPTAADEKLVVQSIVDIDYPDYPQGFLYVADSTKLDKHLLLLTQIRDLGIPVVLALNMSDLADQGKVEIDTAKLSEKLGVPVVRVSSRTGSGVTELKELLLQMYRGALPMPKANSSFYRISPEESKLATALEADFPRHNNYQRILIGHHYEWLPFLDQERKASVAEKVEQTKFNSLQLQVRETMERFDHFTPIVRSVVTEPGSRSGLSEKLDNILTNKVFGPLIFFVLMLFIFQAIFLWAGYPMDMIEAIFGHATSLVKNVLPQGWLSGLIADGLLAGLGGILVFIPQIAILFFLISLLEEVGYMARAAFMFDRLMQVFGLNGRSVVALISGGACAIPAVMSTRTISNWKERLITILVTPFISCSARIPVYTALIAFAVPQKTYLGGVLNAQGLAFMGLYLLGIAAALLAALVFKWILRSTDSSFLMLELPEYRLPVMRNVGLTVWEKVKSFTLEAGKIILIISLVLWILSSYGPGQKMETARAEARQTAQVENLDETATADLIAARQIEASYAGHIGKFLEPAIEPLGFDWKIGIALVTSFAAREVFVGTMATIYSIGSQEDEFSIQQRMAKEVNPKTGEKVYNRATSWSLLLFYVFAMQCMSTLAVVKRETNSWKWPTIQFFFMTGLAYLSSLVVYQVLS
ncbi:MAG TPA: ferrous iron transport protein B [Saprospiraceae bacterium]|nr:ferrous iron transport protein B [Saprospiraceae bacterium]